MIVVNAWKIKQKVIAMVTDESLTIQNALKNKGNAFDPENGGWGGSAKSAENPEKTQNTTVKTPRNDVEKGPNDARKVANGANPCEFRRKTDRKPTTAITVSPAAGSA